MQQPLRAQSRWVKDDGYLILLSLLFWVIFYENLPGDLQGMAGSNGTGGGPPVMDRVFKLSTIAVSVYLMMSRWLLTRQLARHLNPGLWMFTLLVPLSALWSINSSATLLRFVTLGGIIFLCFAFGLASWHPRRFQQVVLPPLFAILLISLGLGMVSLKLVIEAGDDMSQKNAWHGLTHAKNEFGMIASIATIICFNAWLARRNRGIWPLLGTGIAFLCLVLSRSNTSLFATVVALAAMFAIMQIPIIVRQYTGPVAVSVASIILLYESVIQDFIPGLTLLLAPVMKLTGKDMTFSARTVIWKAIKEHIQLSPWLGTGYGAYWTGPTPDSPSYIFLALMYFYPTESHNGYLEVVNDLGLLGLGVILVFLGFFVRQALQLMRTDRPQAALFLALLFQQMVMNMSESDWFSRSNSFAVFTLASVCLSRGLLDARLRADYAAAQAPVAPAPAVAPVFRAGAAPGMRPGARALRPGSRRF